MNRISASATLDDLNSMISETDTGIPTDCLQDSHCQDNTSDRRTSSSASTDVCAVFTPLHYEANYAYPLLIWLHGEGENENHLRRVMPKISMRNYAAVAPRGTLAIARQRFPKWEDTFTWSLRNSELNEAMDRVCMAMERAQQRFRVDTNRIFLAGSGTGGTMALQIGMTLPERFAGIVSVGGSLPREDALMAHLNESRHLPILLMVDRDNDRYPDAMVCQDLRLLHIAGMTVTLRQYPAGDVLRDSMLSDIDPWMMDVLASGQRTPIVTA